MRFVLYVTAVAGLCTGITAAAVPLNAKTKTTCGDELMAQMQDDPNNAGNCEVIATNGDRQLRKVFHAEIVNDLSDGVADTKIQLKEFCENCKTAGATTLHAINFRDIATWASEHAANELAGEPDPETLSNDCLISNDTMPTTPDMLQCRVTALRSQATIADLNAYYGKFIQPRLQRLAVSKNRELQALLRHALTAVAGAAPRSTVVAESLGQFQALGKVIDQANTYEQAMLAASAQPQVRVELTRAWKATQAQAITDFTNRTKLLKSQGVVDQSLLANGDAMVNVIRTLGFPGGNAPNVPPSLNTPRTTFGTPGLLRPASPTAPASRTQSAPGGVPAGLFHAS